MMKTSIPDVFFYISTEKIRTAHVIGKHSVRFGKDFISFLVITLHNNEYKHLTTHLPISLVETKLQRESIKIQ